MPHDPFLGWGLRSVELSDQAILAPFFQSFDEPLSDYTFSQIFTWRNSLRILWKRIEGHLCIFANGTGDLTLLMPPLGDGDFPRALRQAFELMNDYNAAHGVPDRSRVEYASEAMLARIDPAGLNIEPMGADYLYDVDRMIDLAGGDFASKRQAKNRFLRLYSHRVEFYQKQKHLGGCLALLEQWKTHQDAAHPGESNTNALKRQKESLASALALEHAHDLGLKGMVVYVAAPEGGESIRGFTFGEPLGRDQSSIVIEKTDLEVKGLAQFIFSDFCRLCWSDRPLVNAGDDWGLESLAWTKQSYRPVKMLRKFVLRQKVATQVAVPEATTAPPAPAPVTIRRATRRDLEAAVALERDCFTTYSLKKRQIEYLHGRSTAVFLVAERDGEVVGEGISLIRHHKRGPSGRVYSLAVRPDCRGQKIGQKLMRAMMEELAGRGVRRIYLEVEQTNAGAIRLYETLGFRSIGKLPDYYGDGRDGLHMMHEIPATVQAPGPVAA